MGTQDLCPFFKFELTSVQVLTYWLQRNDDMLTPIRKSQFNSKVFWVGSKYETNITCFAYWSLVSPVPHVDQSLLEEISNWESEGCTKEDVITRLRQRTVPHEYTYHPWTEGTSYLIRVAYLQSVVYLLCQETNIMHNVF